MENKLNQLHIGDYQDLCKKIPNKFINLLVTSPPYANTTRYGKEVEIFHPDNYVEWILPLFHHASDFMAPDGSIILNINDKVDNGKRSIYVFDLICRVVRETDFYLHDRYVWAKKNGLPSGSEPRRLDDRIEWILHFVPKVFGANGKELKKPNKFKANLKGLREPHKPITFQRSKHISNANKTVRADGKSDSPTKAHVTPAAGRIPSSIFSFNNSACLPKGSVSSTHPAPFHPEIPEWFIEWLTNKGDVVLDPFMGSGSTALAAEKLKRKWLGFDLNPTYKEMVDTRLNETYRSHLHNRDSDGKLKERYTL